MEELLNRIQKEFFKMLEQKNSWGKDAIKAEYLKTVGRVALSLLTESFDEQNKENT